MQKPDTRIDRSAGLTSAGVSSGGLSGYLQSLTASSDLTPPDDIITILGPDVLIKGNITFEKSVRLHGRVEGAISTPGRLHVAREGRVDADVDAASIVVEGDIHGNLVASDRVELRQTAHIEGDIRALQLTVEPGAVFTGNVRIGPDALKQASDPPKLQLVHPPDDQLPPARSL